MFKNNTSKNLNILDQDLKVGYYFHPNLLHGASYNLGKTRVSIDLRVFNSRRAKF